MSIDDRFNEHNLSKAVIVFVEIAYHAKFHRGSLDFAGYKESVVDTMMRLGFTGRQRSG